MPAPAIFRQKGDVYQPDIVHAMVNVNVSDRALFLKKDFERRAALVAVVMERLKLELLLEKCFLLFQGQPVRAISSVRVLA